ncbi:YesN/AraC family two-component response regulator [Paenibacillus phyllosphaerae]|uniref:YesN/AraC family two-component response regulator n=1 Tax=Paenibacillus phyllosphaerae TaxID=274593 RepID=A0A7W5B2H3_9BACL|nr:response regulator [Paenibacillus phyllosphaerae]MBB3113027.1 YesN/AraC family two-component response regulator [Paenibacillus phyllosphaerae]
MDRITVMIVDDEVLAIEHLKQMLDWESEGFRIVGSSSRPLQALTKVAELKPDLIIADIRMPQLDGISFSKRVIAAGHRCRIILLTSYKEFDYVKEALSIGVAEYLVKHELEPETLRRELIKVRTAALEERRRSAMMLRQYLKELTEGNTPAAELEAASVEQVNVKGREFTYVLLSAEGHLSVLPVFEGLEVPALSNIEIPRLPFHEIELAYKKKGRIGYLLSAEPVASKKEAAERNLEAAVMVQRDVQSTGKARRIAVAYSEPFNRLADLQRIHKATMEQLTAGVLFDDAAVVEPGSSRSSTMRREQVAVTRDRVAETIASGDAAAIATYLHASFDHVIRTRSLGEVSELCEAWTSALDTFRVERGLPALKQLMEEGGIRTDQWRTLAGIRAWLHGKLEEAFASGTHQGYSRKIRETMEYIAAHYAEELSAESIALHLGISGEHLRHLFKQETGQTLLDYITMYRIEKAKSLLESGRFRLYEIAGKVGYKSSHYFSKVFSKLVGMSPLDYAEAKGTVQ